MLRSLKLDFENKKISNEFIKSEELIIQEIILALQCWAGDWFLDGTQGIEYDLRLIDKGLLLADVKNIILSNDNVLSVQDLDIKSTKEDGILVFNITGTLNLVEQEEVIFNGLIPIIGV